MIDKSRSSVFLILPDLLFVACSSTPPMRSATRDKVLSGIESVDPKEQKEALSLLWESWGYPDSQHSSVVSFIEMHEKSELQARTVARVLFNLALSSPDLQPDAPPDKFGVVVLSHSGPPNNYVLELEALLRVYPGLRSSFRDADLDFLSSYGLSER